MIDLWEYARWLLVPLVLYATFRIQAIAWRHEINSFLNNHYKQFKEQNHDDNKEEKR